MYAQCTIQQGFDGTEQRVHESALPFAHSCEIDAKRLGQPQNDREKNDVLKPAHRIYGFLCRTAVPDNSSSARFSFKTDTRGSPSSRNCRPSVRPITSVRSVSSLRPRAWATRGTCNIALAGVI